jgi:DNA-binding MarR family transcriptional regulator
MSRPSEIDALVETAVYLYTEGRRVTKATGRALGLTGPQVTALKLLEGIGRLSLSDLSARMSAKNSTITGLVDRMVRDGLVERQRSEDDRRVVLIGLTVRGRELAARIPVTAMQVFGSALRALSAQDRAQLTEILGRVVDHVRREVERLGEQADGVYNDP